MEGRRSPEEVPGGERTLEIGVVMLAHCARS